MGQAHFPKVRRHVLANRHTQSSVRVTFQWHCGIFRISYFTTIFRPRKTCKNSSTSKDVGKGMILEGNEEVLLLDTTTIGGPFNHQRAPKNRLVSEQREETLRNFQVFRVVAMNRQQHLQKLPGLLSLNHCESKISNAEGHELSYCKRKS